MQPSTDNMGMVFIGIDNGSSGSIGEQVYNKRGMRVAVHFYETPVDYVQDYTKKKQTVSQLRLRKLKGRWRRYMKQGYLLVIAMERPMTGKFFKAILSGARIHQQYLDLCQLCGFPEPRIIDSKEWQQKYLTRGVKGSTELKKASKTMGIKLWPQFADDIRKHKDADGLFISEWVRHSVMMGN